MAKTQDLKRRIRSISNTRKLTRAMKMVSAAKLRRTQERMMSARPYAHRTLAILRSLAARANPEEHPLLQPRTGKRFELAVVTGDKGLCGSFNSAILRTATDYIAEQSESEMTLTALGKKGRDFFRGKQLEVRREWVEIFRDLTYSVAEEIGNDLIQRYSANEVDRVCIVFNEFKSAIQARPIVQQLLPIEPIELDGGGNDYIYEPDPQTLFSALLPHYIKNQIFQALLESLAAEHAARMTAMEAATTNAGELIDSLTLTMNRVRQTAITTEIIEVVSGAEALG